MDDRRALGYSPRVRVLGLLIVAATVGCFNYRAATSGHVGCPPDEIEISDADSPIATTWTATCHGKKYYCSAAGKVSCTRADEDPVASTPTTPTRKSWQVSGPHWSMTLPGSFTAEIKKGRKLFHPDGHWGTVVFLDIETFAGTAMEYAHDKFEGRTIKKAEANGQHGALATEIGMLEGQKRRISTMVLAAEGDAYALTCADSELEETSERCKAIFQSFQVEGAD